MSVSVELSPKYFHNILHALIRHGDNLEEKQRVKGVMQWVGESTVSLGRLTTDAQARVINLIFDHYREHGYPPSRGVIDQIAKSAGSSANMVTVLTEYDRFAPTLELAQPLDMPALLEIRRKDWQRVAVSEALDQAYKITNGSVVIDTRKPALQGPKDALAYIMAQMQEGLLIEEMKASGGIVQEDTKGIRSRYEETERRNASGCSQMRTGIRVLDDSLGGLQHNEFVGLLGFAASRKSAVARTIAYTVAEQGFNVLFIPLEDSYEEVRDIFGVLHCYSYRFTQAYGRDWIQRLGISNVHLRKGTLNQEQKDFLWENVLPDLAENLPGQIVIKSPAQRTWPQIKQLIEMEDERMKIQGKKIDMVVIDYLSLVDVSNERDRTRAMNDVIKDAKQFALNFDNQRGLCLVTPIQGSREGNKEAASNEGRWNRSGMREFNEFETSLNICIFVYVDEILKAANSAKIGTCKSRYTNDVPPTSVSIDPLCGLVINYNASISDSEDRKSVV